MKKFISITLVIIGVILFSLRNIEVETPKTSVRIVDNIYYREDYPTWPYYSTTWNLEGTFYEGEFIGVDFRPSWDWTLPQFDEETLPPNNGTLYKAVKRLDVNVTNPEGSPTCISIYLVITKPYSGDASAVTIFPDYFKVEQKGGLMIEEGYPKAKSVRNNTTNYNMIILGKVPHKGTYRVRFTLDYKIIDTKQSENKTRPWIRDPIAAPYVWLYGVKEIVEVSYPFAYLTFAGPIIAVLGAMLFCVSIIKDKNRKVNFAD